VNRRQFLKQMGKAGCLIPAGGSLASAIGQEPHELPNIILCMADDQGRGDMGYYGHPYVKTPNFDAMSEASLRLDRFYSAAPVCSPTRASVLTGRHPNRTGVLNHGLPMRPQESTIAEALQKKRYATGHFGKWHVGSLQKNSPVNPSRFGFDEWLSGMNFFDRDPLLCHNGVVQRYEGESEEIVVDAAIDFIRKQAKQERPFLAVVWFANPHAPHEALPKYKKLYEGKPHAGYFAEITAMDHAFGKLRRAIRDSGIRDNTILWYTSDNGGLAKESSGGRAKKGSIYEGGLRVPAMIEWPNGISAPDTSSIPCVTSDIYPTLLDITGMQAPHDRPLDGVSLLPLLNGRMKSRSEPIGFWEYPTRGRATWNHKILGSLREAQQKGEPPGQAGRPDMDAGEINKTYSEDMFPGHAAWLDWPWKLHRKQKKNRENVDIELYNLEKDPNAKNNVADRQKDRARNMKDCLERWQASVIRSLNGKDYR